MSQPTNPGRRRPRRAAPTDAFTLDYETTRIKEPDAAPPRPAVTERFSERYAVGAPLGVGGMAEVNLCLDRRIGREVALKVPLTQRREVDTARARFVREARIQGQLEHPSVVPVYDLGVDDGGADFLSMRRVAGQTLEHILDAIADGDEAAVARFTRNRLLSIYRNVCQGIEYAHARGVIHRDLKPSNIMIGAFGEVYVLDWGIAKVRNSTSNRVDTLDDGADDDAITGTPGYMSPEQLSGTAAEATDVYALGAILFELLTLEPLHNQDDIHDLMDSTRVGAESRPSLRFPELEVPPELERACVTATSLEPDDRYATVGDLTRVVGDFLDGDRDLKLRRELAQKHADLSEAAVIRALRGGADGDAQRSVAMREAGKALALNPNSKSAIDSILVLTTQPPTDMPPAARAELANLDMEEMSKVVRVAPWVFLLFVAVALVDLGSGSKLGQAHLGAYLALTLAALLSSPPAFRLFRRAYGSSGALALLPLAPLLLSFVAIAAAVDVVGPLMFIPAVSTGALVASGYMVHRRYRTLMAVLAVGCVLGPMALQWAGLVAPYYLVEADGVKILSNVTFRPSFVLMTLLSVGLVLIPAVIVWRARDVTLQMRERLHLHLWHLRHLLPESGKLSEALVAASVDNPGSLRPPDDGSA